MSALTRNELRAVRSARPSASESPLSPSIARRTASATTVPPAPAALSLPTSSLSKSAIMRTPVSSARLPPSPASSSALSAQKEEARLSSLPL